MLIHIIKHAPGAPGLRFLGLGPGLVPCKGIKKLQRLFNQNAFWAKNRNSKDIRKMLANSSAVLSIWDNRKLIGFGRVTTDNVYRAVIWDVVVDASYQGNGIGTLVVEAILDMKQLKNIDKIYLMTTNQKDFYLQMGFEIEKKQYLLLRKKLSMI